MSKSAKAQSGGLYSINPGNGTVQGISDQLKDIIEFTPDIATLTHRRALNANDEVPTFSLESDGLIEVFGTEDVFTHGDHETIRRLSTSFNRQKADDYRKLIFVLWLQLFGASRGNSRYLKPRGIISVPIDVYNNEKLVEDMQAMLVGRHILTDFEGCVLKIEVDHQNLMILPESTGDMFHYAFGYDLNTQRVKDRNKNTAGVSVVIDIGYETTDISTYIGLEYQRDKNLSYTIPNAGIGNIVRDVVSHLSQSHTGVHEAKVDKALRPIAPVAEGGKKMIEFSAGTKVDVQEVYDHSRRALVKRIVRTLHDRTRDNIAINRVLPSGGGAYHCTHLLAEMLPDLDFDVIPDMEHSGVLGNMSVLHLFK